MKFRELSVPPVDVSKESNLSETDRLKLMRTLNSLLPQQLEELVVSVNPPGSVIPPATAAQGDRTAALIRWAESPNGIGLQTVQDLLDLILEEDEKNREFITYLIEVRKEKELEKEIPNIFKEIGVVYTDFARSFFGSKSLVYELTTKKLDCIFLQSLYAFLDRNKDKNYSHVKKRTEEFGKRFVEKCDVTKQLSQPPCNDTTNSYLHVYVKAAERDLLEVSAKLCPQFESIEYEDGKPAYTVPSTSLKETINRFIESAIETEKKLAKVIDRIELFLPIFMLNEKLNCLLDEGYIRDYAVTICFSECLKSEAKAIQKNLEWHNKNISFKCLFSNSLSALEGLRKEDVLEWETTDLRTKDFLKSLSPSNPSKPIGIKIKPQTNTNLKKSEGVPIDNGIFSMLIKQGIYIPIVLWSTWDPSDLDGGADKESKFDALLAPGSKYTLQSLLNCIRDLRADALLFKDFSGEEENYLGYHLNIVYTDLKGLLHLLDGMAPLNDKLFN